MSDNNNEMWLEDLAAGFDLLRRFARDRQGNLDALDGSLDALEDVLEDAKDLASEMDPEAWARVTGQRAREVEEEERKKREDHSVDPSP